MPKASVSCCNGGIRAMLAGERWRHDRRGAMEERLVREESCASGFLVSARPIGWASLDEEAREGIDGKVDKAEAVQTRRDLLRSQRTSGEDEKYVPNGLKSKRSQYYTPLASCYGTRETGGSWRGQSLCQCGSCSSVAV